MHDEVARFVYSASYSQQTTHWTGIITSFHCRESWILLSKISFTRQGDPKVFEHSRLASLRNADPASGAAEKETVVSETAERRQSSSRPIQLDSSFCFISLLSLDSVLSSSQSSSVQTGLFTQPPTQPLATTRRCPAQIPPNITAPPRDMSCACLRSAEGFEDSLTELPQELRTYDGGET